MYCKNCHYSINIYIITLYIVKSYVIFKNNVFVGEESFCNEEELFMSNQDILIEAKNLTKKYIIPKKEKGLSGAVKYLFLPKHTEKYAVNDIDLQIYEGESVAYIGSNGAGKSTTIKMLTGILQPTSGEVSVCGLVPNKNRVKNAYNIGVMFGQKTQLWWDIPIIETFSLLKHVYEVPDDKYKKQLNFLVDLLDMSSFMGQSARQLSLGQRVRADLAASFLHNPKILFLDEPTIGLDIMGKKAVRSFLKEVNQKLNKTIMLTSHDLWDIHEICKKVVIIDKGRIIYQGSIAEMLSTYSSKKIMTIDFNAIDDFDVSNVKKYSESILAVSRQQDDRIRIEYNPKKIGTTEVLSILSKYGEVGEISISEEGIEDIVEKLYLGKLDVKESYS